MGERDIKKDLRSAPSEIGSVAFSNGIRLTGSEWLVVAFVAALLIVVAPTAWKQAEKFPLEADYRMPHELSNDYWLYERFAGLAVERQDTLLVGDSVIWGEYVTRQETLSHYVNELVGED